MLDVAAVFMESRQRDEIEKCWVRDEWLICPCNNKGLIYATLIFCNMMSALVFSISLLKEH